MARNRESVPGWAQPPNRVAAPRAATYTLPIMGRVHKPPGPAPVPGGTGVGAHTMARVVARAACTAVRYPPQRLGGNAVASRAGSPVVAPAMYANRHPDNRADPGPVPTPANSD